MASRLPTPSPRKRLGQHFLIDPNIVRKTIRLAALQPQEPVLEIGPGLGILTQALCEQGRAVTAIEIDHRLVDYLQQTLGDIPQLDIRQGDALEFPYQTLPQGTVVVANLPYYISTALLFRLLESQGRITRIIVMVQTEVAIRMIAQPGTSDYGILSVLVQFWAKVTKAFSVPATCFRPKPEVASSVVQLIPRPFDSDNQVAHAHFVQTVRAAFAHRRKTMSNSLRDAGYPSRVVQQAMEKVKLDPRCRAETLSLQEFCTLSQALQEFGREA